MKDLKNLRNRPFLIVNSVQRPAKGVNTSKKGWADNPSNWNIFEQPAVADRVNAKAMTTATVIIDVMSGSVVKSRFDNVPDAEIVEHYLNKYRPQVAEAMDIWLTRAAKNITPEQLSAMKAQSGK